MPYCTHEQAKAGRAVLETLMSNAPSAELIGG
jgi:hypothetical protein